jgi:mono/diheme cytochrome c family protein
VIDMDGSAKAGVGVVRHSKRTAVRLLTIGWSLAVALALSACGGADSAPADAVRGQAEYLRYCSTCHGADGQGRAPTFPPLAGSEWMSLPPETLTAIVLRGLRGEIEVAGSSYRGYMPPLPHIEDASLAAIVAYTKQRWSDETPTWRAEDVAAVRARVAGQPPFDGMSEFSVSEEAARR